MKADVDVEEIGHRFMVMLIDCPVMNPAVGTSQIGLLCGSSGLLEDLKYLYLTI